MARSVDEQEHTAKRNKILAAAQKLIYTKGFERMTVQDLIDQLGISKGAFFHYFASKRDLLEALIDQMTLEILTHLNAILEDPGLNAAQKLEKYFRSALHWKAERRDLMIAIMHAWYLDENAIVRQKAFDKGMLEQFVPILTRLIEQGNRDGSWNAPHAGAVALMSVYLLQSWGDTLSRKLLNSSSTITRAWLEETVQAYTESMERLLGAPAGSLTLFDVDELAVWFLPAAHEQMDAPSASEKVSFAPTQITERENR